MNGNTIKQNKDFRRAYYRGKSKASPILVTYVLRFKNGSRVRYGITSGKKTGNAVERNRCRRIVRAAYAQLRQRIIAPCDIVFVTRSKTKHVKTQDISAVMESQLSQLGVLGSDTK